jgi:hypothetical protein
LGEDFDAGIYRLRRSSPAFHCAFNAPYIHLRSRVRAR